MINIKDKKDCCGCNACGDICPAGAVQFEKDEEGFLYPVVDARKCTNCGLCDKTCPQLHHKELKVNEFAEPKCYAATHKNFATLFDSTSGGAFSAMANVVYRKGGFVGGAIWNDDFTIRQYISADKNDLPKLRSSKYAQSDARGFYNAVKVALKTGKPVLVCGCPCQIFALKGFLGKCYDNLYLMDFICRGNNSPLVFRKYLDWQEGRNHSKIVYVKPKNKELGWRNLTTKLVFDNGNVIYDTKETSYFTKGYLSTNAYCRPSCYDCKFKGLPRLSDVTVADFWGANDLKLKQELDRNLGTSLVLLNNAKGMSLFDSAKTTMHVQELTWEQAKSGNAMWNSSLPPPRCDRKEFFEILNEQGFGAVAERFISCKTNHRTLKTLIRGMASRARRIAREFMASPMMFFRCLKLNGLRRTLKGSGVLWASRSTIVEVDGNLQIESGTLRIGGKYFYKKDPVSSAIGVRSGGKMIVKGDAQFVYGADIEVFNGGLLEVGAGSGFNIGATIVCGNQIKIGQGVKAGRHVTIRDNNGGHWMNLPGYKDSKPVEIGDHVWLCEGCTIMPGVKIGAGAVIGAKAVVFNNVPANSLVVGNPAEVVCDNVEWKY